MKTKGLTLLEVMIVVAIIGLVAAIAIPAVTRLAEDVKADICRTNLNTIDKVKIQWAFDNSKSDTDEPTADDLEGYIAGNVPKECVVAGALYDLGSVITPALCSFHGNGVVEGAGIKVPSDVASLFKEGGLTASEITDGDWYWNGEEFITYSYERECREGNTLVEDKYIEMNSVPEININGKILTGDEIVHYSKDGMEDAKYYNDELGKTHFLSKMEEGGYIVYKGQEEHYYDNKGNRVGYKVKNLAEGRYYCYGSDGNLLGEGEIMLRL